MRSFIGKALGSILKFTPESVKRIFKQLPGIVRIFEYLDLRLDEFRRLSKMQEPLATAYDRDCVERGLESHTGRLPGLSVHVFGPIPPVISGIATFTENFATSLSKYCYVGVRSTWFSSEGPPNLIGARSWLTQDEPTDGCEHDIYMIGNGPMHAHSWSAMLNKPGYVFLHDARIPDLPLTNQEIAIFGNFKYSDRLNRYLSRLPVGTKGIFALSQETKLVASTQLSEEQKRDIPIHVLEVGHPTDIKPTGARKLSSSPVVATFGFQNSQKHPGPTIEVISKLSREIDATGLVCGDTPKEILEMYQRAWKREGNSPSDLIVLQGLDDKAFAAQMNNADLAIQFRKYSNGETSGIIPMLAARGVLTAVSDIGSFSELPSEIFFKVNHEEKFFKSFGNSYHLNSLVSHLASMLTSPDLYEKSSEKLTVWAKNKSFDVLAREILRTLELDARA
jgi:hypothetical protein